MCFRPAEMSMNTCPKCGKTNRPIEKTCVECGEPLENKQATFDDPLLDPPQAPRTGVSPKGSSSPPPVAPKAPPAPPKK